MNGRIISYLTLKNFTRYRKNLPLEGARNRAPFVGKGGVALSAKLGGKGIKGFGFTAEGRFTRESISHSGSSD